MIMIQTEHTSLGMITVRPAEVRDIPALSNLLVQLYAAELPGALTGAPADQAAVLAFTLEAQLTRGLRHRYVLCDATNQVLATGMIQFPTDPPYERAPSGTIRKASQTVGYWATGRLILTVARNMIGGYQQKNGITLLHSLVVDAEQRGRGIGQMILRELENIVAEAGYEQVELQVLADNTSARQLYVRAGYRDVWESPTWVNVLSWASYVMQKSLKCIESDGQLE